MGRNLGSGQPSLQRLRPVWPLLWLLLLCGVQLLVLSAALVTTVMVGAGAVDVHRLRHGPVALLAKHRAVVSADLEIRGDLHRVAASGNEGCRRSH